MIDDRKEPQKTNAGRKPPLRVAEGPPDTPEGRRAYDERTLRESGDYAEDRSEEAAKPYSAEVESLEAEKRILGDGDSVGAREDRAGPGSAAGPDRRIEERRPPPRRP